MEKVKLTIKLRDSKKSLELLRGKGILPGVLYGPKVKSRAIEINAKDFGKAYGKAGASSLISLIDEDGKEILVLIHETQKDPLSSDFIHVDFYAPILTKEVEAMVPLVFEGEALAVKDLSGTFVKGLQEVEVKALPQDLPHEIRVNIEVLKTFENEILVKDLVLPKGVVVTNEPDTLVASVLPPEKVEEELEKPIEEKVEDVEVVEKEKKETEEGEGGSAAPAGTKEQK